MDIKSIIADAKRPERTVSVCLRPDLYAEWQRVSNQLVEARKAGRRSLDDAGPVALAEQVASLEQQMAESTVEFVLRGLPPSRVRAIQSETDDDEALALAVLRESMVAPQLDDAEWDALFGDDGVLTMGEVGRLADASNAVNFRATSVPSSRLASAALSSSDES